MVNSQVLDNENLSFYTDNYLDTYPDTQVIGGDNMSDNNMSSDSYFLGNEQTDTSNQSVKQQEQTTSIVDSNGNTTADTSSAPFVPDPAAVAAFLAESAYAHKSRFDKEVSRYAAQRPLSTGFVQLDNALDGGLYPGLYTVGAMTSLGKTALVLQMSVNIAASGQDVLYFSLEIGEAELMARSISHETYREAMDSGIGEDAAKTMWGVLDGGRYCNYTQDELDLIQAARDKYDVPAKHLYFYEGRGSVGVKAIREKVEQYISVFHAVPLVVIDYMQMLAPYSERLTDKQNIDKNTMELKRLSRDLHIPVIAISSYNRTGYETKATLKSLKESGGLEYTSDVVIALQLQGMGTEGFDVDAAKSAIPRYIEAVFLKNRNSLIGETVNFEYQPKFHCFREMQWNEQPILPGTPKYVKPQKEKGGDLSSMSAPTVGFRL